MKKVLLLIVLIAISISCFAMLTPPDNLVYKYWKSEYDHVLVGRNKECGWYVWDINEDRLNVKVVSDEAITTSGTREVWVYSQPKGYVSSLRTVYYVNPGVTIAEYDNAGYLYKKEDEFSIPVRVPEKSLAWMAYFKTTDDFYNYWLEGKLPKKEME